MIFIIVGKPVPSQMMGSHLLSSLEGGVDELMSSDIRGMEKIHHFPHYRLADGTMHVDITLTRTITR